MSNSEISALEKLVKTIFLPDLVNFDLVSLFVLLFCSFLGIYKWAIIKKINKITAW